jgi:hypothetical protein
MSLWILLLEKHSTTRPLLISASVLMHRVPLAIGSFVLLTLDARRFSQNRADAVTGMSGANGDTLGDLSRRTAFAQLPSRFHLGLQLCAPLAIQLWHGGWHRTAGWLLVVSSFSLWAIAQQRLHGHADDLSFNPPSPSATRRWHFVRRTAAGVGLLIGGILAAEAFTQLMAVVFKCPGCAG